MERNKDECEIIERRQIQLDNMYWIIWRIDPRMNQVYKNKKRNKRIKFLRMKKRIELMKNIDLRMNQVHKNEKRNERIKFLRMKKQIRTNKMNKKNESKWMTNLIKISEEKIKEKKNVK